MKKLRPFRLKGIPLSAQRPHPPIMMGGGSKRVLGIAAREADIVSLNIRTTPGGGFDLSSLTIEAAAQKVEWIRQAAEKIHREWEMSDDELTVEQLLDSPSFLIGSVEQIIEQLQMLREKFGISYYSVWEPIEPFAPIVARLSGT